VADSGNHAVRRLQPLAGGLQISAVTSGATNQSGVIAPGEVLALYGAGMGPAQLAQSQLVNGRVPTTLAGTTVYFNGTAAPVLYTSAGQVGVAAPFGLSGDKADVVVTYQGAVSAALSVSVAASAPGIFTLDGSGTGQAAAINPDGGINGPDRPARAGQIVTLYATGAGRMNPAAQDGAPATAPLPLPVLPVALSIGGKSVQPQYAGAATGLLAGVVQVNAEIPTGLTAGAVPVVLQVGTSSSPNGVTIYVQ
jgi:trimeric autotransporter adhesin